MQFGYQSQVVAINRIIESIITFKKIKCMNKFNHTYFNSFTHNATQIK